MGGDTSGTERANVHATDIAGYTYAADQYCSVSCVTKSMIRHGHSFGSLLPEDDDELNRYAESIGVNVEDEYSFDSDHFPKVFFNSQLTGEEWCGECLNHISCDGWGCEDCEVDDSPDQDVMDFPENPYAGPGGLLDEFRQAERLIGTE